MADDTDDGMDTAWTGDITRSDVVPGQGVEKFANVRYNNPGSIQRADWAKQFGARTYGVIGGGNTIVRFPTKVAGAAAQFNLLGRRYVGKSLRDAVATYTGAGSGTPGTGAKADLDQYTAALSKATGLGATDRITPEFLSGPGGIALAKAQAASEGPLTGYPLTDDEWAQAQKRGLTAAKSMLDLHMFDNANLEQAQAAYDALPYAAQDHLLKAMAHNAGLGEDPGAYTGPDIETAPESPA